MSSRPTRQEIALCTASYVGRFRRKRYPGGRLAPLAAPSRVSCSKPGAFGRM